VVGLIAEQIHISHPDLQSDLELHLVLKEVLRVTHQCLGPSFTTCQLEELGKR
jgi:hypothetical protein